MYCSGSCLYENYGSSFHHELTTVLYCESYSTLEYIAFAIISGLLCTVASYSSAIVENVSLFLKSTTPTILRARALPYCSDQLFTSRGIVGCDDLADRNDNGVHDGLFLKIDYHKDQDRGGGI